MHAYIYIYIGKKKYVHAVVRTLSKVKPDNFDG